MAMWPLTAALCGSTQTEPGAGGNKFVSFVSISKSIFMFELTYIIKIMP